MKITFVIFSLRGGGAERMVSRLSNNFVKRGIDVDILLLFTTENRAYTLDNRVGVFDISFPSIKNKTIKKLRQVFAIRDYIKNKKPEVIIPYIITIVPFVALANFGLKNGTKIIGSQRTNPKKISLIRRLIVYPFLKRCDGFVFQTNGARDCYPNWLKRKSRVIGNIAPDNNCSRHELHKGNEICAVGRLHEAKDFETLIKAIDIVKKTHSTICLHIYGQGPREESLRELVGNMRLNDNIIFEGFSKNVEKELQKYDIYVFSSKAEGMPNSLVEAMASGMACVATDCDYGPSDLIEDGVNGYLVPVGDFQTMAQRIIHLLENEEIRLKMMRAAEQIRKKYSEEKIVDEYLNYAKWVCREH